MTAQREMIYRVPSDGTTIGVRELTTLEMLEIADEAATDAATMGQVLMRTDRLQRERVLTQYGTERVGDQRSDGSTIQALDLIAKMPARHYSLLGRASDKLHEVTQDEVDAFLASAETTSKGVAGPKKRL